MWIAFVTLFLAGIVVFANEGSPESQPILEYEMNALAAKPVYSLRRKSYGDRLYFSETKLASPETEALLDWIRTKVRVGPLK